MREGEIYHIVGLQAENVKRIKAIAIDSNGKRLLQLTGRNDQGKTSVLDCIWYALVGKRAMPDKPVRHGTESARIKLRMGDVTVTRTITASGNMRLFVEADGVQIQPPQKFLDDLVSELTFDPLEFIRMETPQQIEVLRKITNLDFADDTAANKKDFETRRDVNRDLDRVKSELNRLTVQEGLPKERIDEAVMRERIAKLDEQNKRAKQADDDRRDLGTVLATARHAVFQCKSAAEIQRKNVESLKLQLSAAEEKLTTIAKPLPELENIAKDAEKKYSAAPMGEYGDLQKLSMALEEVQLTNREIDKREKRNEVLAEMQSLAAQADALTRAMEDRTEKKRAAIEAAPMPIPGLRFDETSVTYNGIPIEQMGEGGQIRVSCAIAMAIKPEPGKAQLRIMRIEHGEALDKEGMAILLEMAQAHDYQIWMAQVETSGKVGIVIEDGMIQTVNDEEPAHDGDTKNVAAKHSPGRNRRAGVDKAAH